MWCMRAGARAHLQVPRQGSQARVPETVAKQVSQEQVPKQGSQEQVPRKGCQKGCQKGFRTKLPVLNGLILKNND